MPTLTELPQSLTSEDTDQVLIDRDGTTMVTTAAALREPMQKRLTLATGKLLGRVGVFPGGPEPVSLGEGLRLEEGVLSVEPATLQGTNASALTVAAAGTSRLRSLAARAAERLNVRDFGAVGDGVADDRAAIQAAIDAATALPTGGEVYLPPGTYRLRVHGFLLVPKSHVVLRGAGRGRSVLVVDNALGAAGGDGISNSIWPLSWSALEDFHMRDLTVRGLAETMPTVGGQMVRLFGSNLSVENCEFAWSRNMGLVITNSEQVVVRNCRVFRTIADGIAVWDSDNVIIEGNEIIGANDDAISAHTNNATPAPARSGIVIANNTITESQGIAVLGAKAVVIANNVMRRIMGTAIRVVGGTLPSTQGNTAQFAVRITGNIIADVFRRAEPNPRTLAQFYIMVVGGPRNAGTADAAPGEPAPGTGLVAPLYGSGIGSFHANATSEEGAPNPAGYWNEISDNHLVRTLPAVAAVSDWGYGGQGIWVGNNGDGSGFYNGAVTEDHLATMGIRLQPAFRNTRIARNTIQTSGAYGIWFNANVTTRDMDYDGLTIEGNRIVGCTAAAILGPPAGTHRVLVRDNEFDGDPHFAAPTRGPGGTWTSDAGVVGVSLATCSGFTLTGNAFRNLGSAIRQGAGTRHVVGPNILHCDPVAVGFSTANRGMGTVEPGGGGWLHVVESCDPADALYGRIRAATLGVAAAQPDSGTYVAGHFVRASPPVSSGGQTLLGWLRLTTGSLHAAGTDWAAVHGGDGSAGGGVARVTAFTASGTWTRDPAATQVEVEVWGAGGGGGAGTVAAPGTATSGGAAGGGGGKRRARYRAADLPASVAVTVGAAGTRGATTAAGGQGGTSSFGTLLRAFGGGGGAGGATTASGGGGGAGDHNPGNNAAGAVGGVGGGAFGAAGGSGSTGGSERVGGAGGGGGQLGGVGQGGGYAADAACGGGGGGGVSAGGVAFAGGTTSLFNIAGSNLGGTAGGGAPASLPAFAYGAPVSMGGPGGGGATTTAGGAGAAGQTPGGGGGGGGSTQTGQAAGLGGVGGGGLVLVYEW